MSYIEREAVNALIKAECSPKVVAYLIDAVATIPAADVRSAEAEWTEENTCSHCGDEACAGYDEEPWLTRYCPHCGAKMKNPEEYE